MADLTSDAIEALTHGGGGGDSGGMDKRIDRLETKMDRVEERLTSIEVTLARIDTKLDAKIDYKWLTVYALGIVAAVLHAEIAAWISALSR